MTNRNLLLGGGEKLTAKSPIKRGSGPKKRPYKIDDTRRLIQQSLLDIQSEIIALPQDAKPRGEGVFELTLHPAFLARSYYPNKLLRATGLRDIGSKETVVIPKNVTNARDSNKEQATATLYIAGEVDHVRRLLNFLMSDDTEKTVRDELTEIESVGWIRGIDKIKGKLPADQKLHSFEVALHIGEAEEDIFAAFIDFANKNSAKVDAKRKIQVGGITFVPVEATTLAIQNLSSFSFLRVARTMPELRLALPNVVRQSFPNVNLELPQTPALFQGKPVAIFDGGLGASDLAM